MKKIDINGAIVANDDAWIYEWLEWEYTSPKNIKQKLEEANGEEIEFYINSGGGSVYDAGEIYAAILDYPGKTTAKIILACSAASYIALATDKTLISPVGNIMIHNAADTATGNSQVHRDNADFLDTVDNTIVNAYIEKTGKSRAEMLELMSKTKWFTPQEALENGLVDEIMVKKGARGEKPKFLNDIDQEKRKIISKLLEFGNPENLEKAILEGKVKIGQTVTNVATIGIDNQIIESEENVMNKEELQAKYPDLYNQIVQDAQKEAVTNERARIAAINELAKPGVEDQIKKGIEDGLDVGQVAVNILKAQTALNQEAGQAIVKDAEASGLGNVETTPAPQNTEATDREESINLLVNAAKSIMGGKR